jgi:hypothetical protein
MAGLGTLAAGIRPILSTRREYLYLTELDENDAPSAQSVEGDGGAGDPRRRLQYFPETLTDSKAVNYQVKDIPGGSLPLYQWVSSGAREISFTAVWTTDVDHYSQTADQESAPWARAQAIT